MWFALACMIFVPVAIGRKLETKRPGEPRRALDLAITTGLTVALIAVAASLFGRSESWFEGYWPREPVEAVRNAIRPGDRAFISDRFSDWMLFKIPALRGRVAYDIRFELYDRQFFDRLQKYAGETHAELEVVRGRLPDRRRRREAKVPHGGLRARAGGARFSTRAMS